MLASSFSTRFLLRKNRRSRLPAPLGATCSLPHFRFAQMWPRARTPALLVFNSVFAAQKPAQPVTGPTFWVCRAKSGAAFRCAKPPCAVVRFAAMASPPRTAVLPSPSRLRRAGSPTAKPRRLLPFGRISPAAKPRGRSLPAPGATCSLPHFRFAQMWPRIFPRGLPGYVPLFHGWPHARTPALAPVRSHFAPRNRAAGRCPRRGQRARYPIFAPLKCGPAYSRGVCRGTFLCSPAGPALAPRRLLPFGRISLRETARPVIGPTGADVLPSPSRLRRAGSPTAKPRRLLPFGRISPAAKPRGRSLPPLGATCSLPHFRSAQMWPRARTPALLVFNSVFAARKPAGASPRFRTAGR